MSPKPASVTRGLYYGDQKALYRDLASTSWESSREIEVYESTYVFEPLHVDAYVFGVRLTRVFCMDQG